MKKVIYNNTTINVVLQNTEEITSESCPTGIISKDANGDFRFEEAVVRRIDKRNPKLFDGEYLSMVRMQNGKYQFHMKTLQASASLDPRDLAKKVGAEIVKAFKFINA